MTRPTRSGGGHALPRSEAASFATLIGSPMSGLSVAVCVIALNLACPAPTDNYRGITCPGLAQRHQALFSLAALFALAASF